MTLFRRLINSSGNSNDLQQFIAENIHWFNKLHGSNLELLLLEKLDIRDFIETKRILLEELNYSSSTNRSFISILFDFAERFGLLSIVAIENTLIRHELYLGDRRQAAKLFLLNVRNNNDYISRFEDICNLLQSSYRTEEDTDRNIVITFLNYAAKIIRDTSSFYVTLFIESIVKAKNTGKFEFLNHDAINQLLRYDVTDLDIAYSKIQNLIDEILGQTISFAIPEPSKVNLLIESGTEYSVRLSNEQISLDFIRSIAVERCRDIGSELYGRGVFPLRSEDELYIYLYRYGQMHRAKLNTCFESIPFNSINKIVEVFDWGCGQGLASVALSDFLIKNHISLNINSVKLIEPSILSLQRAALHVRLTIDPPIIQTVCKSFDSLSTSDIETRFDNIKIHLLSNILDIEEGFYSQLNLISLIKNTQKGLNFFVCSSPYIDDVKTNRIDNFVNSFSKMKDFELLLSIDKRRGEWKKTWTKAIRVFKVRI